MGISDVKDYQGRVAQIAELANQRGVGPKEMITALSEGNIKAYLTGIKSKKVEIISKDEDKRENRPDFSDLLDIYSKE